MACRLATDMLAAFIKLHAPLCFSALSALPQAKAHARRLVRTYVMGRFIEQASILTPRQLSTMYWALSRLGAAKQYYSGVTEVVGAEILRRISTFNPVDYSMMI